VWSASFRKIVSAIEVWNTTTADRREASKGDVLEGCTCRISLAGTVTAMVKLSTKLQVDEYPCDNRD